jgi:hypothetical protein
LHPLYPNEVTVLNERQMTSGKFYTIQLFDNSRVLLPAWMTDPEICNLCVLQDQPGVSLAALQDLRRLLDGLAL